MSLQKLYFGLTVAALSLAQFAVPAKSHADTYQVTSLENDNRAFYGMDDSGHVVVYGSFFSCGNPSTGCYETFLNGAFLTESSVAPGYTLDFAKGTCAFPQPNTSPCSLTKGSTTATITVGPPGLEDLYVTSGSGPAQLLASTGFGGIYAIDGLGDIVFDNGTLNEWYEAIDLSTTAVTPEPSSLLLLGTGLAGAAILLSRRRLAV